MAKDWGQIGLRPHLSKNERLPRSYKEVEKVLKEVKACKGNLKTVLNNSRLRGSVFKKVYSLATNVLKYRHILDRIIQETELLKKETFLREEIAGILIYELVFGKGLPGESRPVTVIKQYEDSIQKAYENAMKDGDLKVKGLQSLPRYVRVNTLLTTLPDVLKNLRKAEYREVYYGENTSEKEYLDLVRNLETGNYLIDYHFKDLLVFASTENLTTWSLYKKNHVYIQDKSSFIPVYALDPKPGSVVIDACAAPGMKTIHIAAAMQNNGKIYAYEKSENRFEILKGMLESATVEICEAACEDFYLVNANDPKFQDLECILVDPSCSGSGMVNRMDTVTDTEDSKNTFRLQKLAGFQILLLKHALTFPSVKRVVYSTCSISEEENEYVVHEVLNHFRHLFKLVSVVPNWPIRGSDNFEFGKLCLRAHPEETLTNGFFVAMFERMDYDEQLSVSRPFADKSSKRKKKRRENLDERENMDFNETEPRDRSQFLNDTSAKSCNSLKRKCPSEDDFSQNYAGLDKNDVDFQNFDHDNNLNFPDESSYTNESKKKKKHKKEVLSSEISVQIDDKKIDNTEQDYAYQDNVDFLNSTLDNNSNDANESSSANHIKKKKKHKNKIFNHEGNNEIDDKKINNIEKTIPENAFEERQVEVVTKKHKHKKHSKEKAELCDTFEYVAENSLFESEATLTTDTTHRKKHKKKHSKNDSELVDASCETSQVIEEASLKRKHKKKCKDKRYKEE